jgi:hypothetical protein
MKMTLNVINTVMSVISPVAYNDRLEFIVDVVERLETRL